MFIIGIVHVRSKGWTGFVTFKYMSNMCKVGEASREQRLYYRRGGIMSGVASNTIVVASGVLEGAWGPVLRTKGVFAVVSEFTQCLGLSFVDIISAIWIVQDYA